MDKQGQSPAAHYKDENEEALSIEGAADTEEVVLRAEAADGGSLVLAVSKALLLTCDYFKARFERWQPEEAKPIITFELPEGSNPKGLKLMVERMTAGEATNWRNKDWWWRVPDGDVTVLFAALYLMDLLLLESYCAEVAVLLYRFRVKLPEHYLEIGTKHEISMMGPLRSSRTPLGYPSVKVDLEILKTVLERVFHIKGPGAFAFADRLIASATDEALSSALVSVFTHYCKISPEPGYEVSDWLQSHLEDVIRRLPEVAESLLVAILASEDLPLPAANGWLHFVWDIVFVESCGWSQNALDHKKLMAMIPNMLDLTENWLRRHREVSCDFLTEFGAAHVDVQLAILKASRCDHAFCRLVGHRLEEVRPEARITLLGWAKHFDEGDFLFLSTASFPELEECSGKQCVE